MDDAKAPLLVSTVSTLEEDDIYTSYPSQHPYVHKPYRSSLRRRWIYNSLIAIETILCIVLAAILYSVSESTSSTSARPIIPTSAPACSPQGTSTTLTAPPSPADSVLSYNLQRFHKSEFRTSIFVQPPSPAVDAAWHALLVGMNIQVSSSWLSPYNATSIPMRNGGDGDGDSSDSGDYHSNGNDMVAAQLGMYHELHCLKKIRQWTHRDYYHPAVARGSAEWAELEAHVEHCVDWLRLAALCRGDTTLTTLGYDPAGTGRIETHYPVERRCVNADVLMGWSEERKVEITEDLVKFGEL